MKIKIFIFFSLFLILMGCSYQSKVPLSENGNIKIDMGLLGKWVEVSSESKKNGYQIIVYKFSETEYLICFKNLSLAEPVVGFLRGFSVKIGEHTFMNIINIDEDLDEKPRYIFMRYSVTEKGLKIFPVSEDHPKLKNKEFANSLSLYSVIKDSLKDEDLYVDSIEFKKSKNFSIDFVQKE